MIASVAVPDLDELNPEGSAHAEEGEVGRIGGAVWRSSTGEK